MQARIPGVAASIALMERSIARTSVRRMNESAGRAPSSARRMATSSTLRVVQGRPFWSFTAVPAGYYQGELIVQTVQTVLHDRFHWITPSRFGYLQSTFRNGATFDEQAHAYAWLLDHLDVQRVAVVALSHGGPSALLFAVLHPERVSSLTLISCGVGPMTTDDQAQANQKGKMLVDRLIKYMNPASLRYAGAAFDNTRATPGERSRLSVPAREPFTYL